MVGKSIDNNIDEIIDDVPSEMELYWIQCLKDLSKESIKSLDEGAKGILTASSLILTVYIFLISSLIKNNITFINSTSIAISLSPILFLIFAIISSVWIFYPDNNKVNFYSAKDSKNALEKISRRKSSWMKFSLFLLFLGVISLALIIFFIILNKSIAYIV